MERIIEAAAATAAVVKRGREGAGCREVQEICGRGEWEMERGCERNLDGAKKERDVGVVGMKVGGRMAVERRICREGGLELEIGGMEEEKMGNVWEMQIFAKESSGFRAHVT